MNKLGAAPRCFNGRRWTSVFNYPGGVDGIILSDRNHNLARQSPLDYIQGLRAAITAALKQARKKHGVKPDQIAGIGVDTTGSTPVPVSSNNRPMCENKKYRSNPNAYAWLWKDHTSIPEAALITKLAKIRPQYLKMRRCLFFRMVLGKLLHCARIDPGF